jgi:hypothetical protein
MKKMLVLGLLGVMGLAFTKVLTGDGLPRSSRYSIPASPQRSGDVAAGYQISHDRRLSQERHSLRLFFDGLWPEHGQLSAPGQSECCYTVINIRR